MIRFTSGGAAKLKKKLKYIIIVLLLLIGILIIPLLCGDNDIPNPLKLLDPDRNAEEWNGNQELPQAGKNEEVLVPGFNDLVCYAGQTTQKVNLYNPAENSCLMRMTLYADDKKLWSNNGYLEPGKGYYEIEFSEPLAVGTYDGTLLVECFLKDGTECNAVKVEFQLQMEEKEA